MSLQGTWADHIIIQAVADALNLKIHIIESNETFRDIHIVEGINAVQNTVPIFLRHIGNTHYVSTLSISTTQNSQLNFRTTETSSAINANRSKRSCNAIGVEHPDVMTFVNNINAEIPSKVSKIYEFKTSQNRKEKKAAYMRQYRANTQSREKKAKSNERVKIHREKTASPEKRARDNEYKKRYRKSKASEQQKAKFNDNQQKYRATNASNESKEKNKEYQRKFRAATVMHQMN